MPNYTSEIWLGRKFWYHYEPGITPIFDQVLFEFWDDRAWDVAPTLVIDTLRGMLFTAWRLTNAYEDAEEAGG